MHYRCHLPGAKETSPGPQSHLVVVVTIGMVCIGAQRSSMALGELVVLVTQAEVSVCEELRLRIRARHPALERRLP